MFLREPLLYKNYLYSKSFVLSMEINSLLGTYLGLTQSKLSKVGPSMPCLAAAIVSSLGVVVSRLY